MIRGLVSKKPALLCAHHLSPSSLSSFSFSQRGLEGHTSIQGSPPRDGLGSLFWRPKPGLVPARLQSQADTMGRPHVRFLGEETHSLWTERSGQDIYNGLKKKKKKPGLQPPLSPSTSEMSCNTPSSLNIQTQNKCANSISPGNLGPMAAG